MTAIVSIWLALALAAAAAAKARRPQESAAALATYGIVWSRVQRATLWLLVAGEACVALALAAGISWGRAAAAGLFVAFTCATAAALVAGREGRPCACFGASARLGRASLAARRRAVARRARGRARRGFQARPPAMTAG